MLEGPPLRALYLGGGTPTALSARDIARLVEALREGLPLAPDCEITLEGRISGFTPDKVRAAFGAGVNRISLGVQTFDERLRRALGRKASRAEVMHCLEQLIAADAGAIVIDLLYGLPNQTPELWAADLATVTALGLDGLDLYGLNLIPGTPLPSAVASGKLVPIRHFELGRFYATGAEALDRAGWTPISTTHWRRGVRERSIYNYEAKTGADLLAFGAGAGGSLGGTGFRLVSDLADYARRIDTNSCPAVAITEAAPNTALHDAIRQGMERGRLAPDAPARLCRERTGAELLALVEPLLAQWQEAGLLTRHHDFYDLTLAGRFWQVQMTARLTDWIDQELSLRSASREGDRDDRTRHDAR